MLKRALAKAKDKGFTFYVHPEIEFYLFESQDDWSKAPTPIDEGGYFDHVPRSPGMDFRRATVNMLEQMGISVEYSHHEAGPGQNEIDLRYADALTTADNIMTFRTVVKEISLERGIHASFMPKPLADAPGSGMHTHLSLFEGDSNAFYEAGQEFNMSLTARQFAAGILYHAAEICAVTDQYVNSYKRLWGGNEAPSYICWGHNNRSALLRIPQYKPGKGNSARMEFRALDPVANPYLAYSVLLAAGLDGIDKQMQLGEPTSDDVWELTDGERQAMGIQPLPRSLDEALKIMEKSDFVADVRFLPNPFWVPNLRELTGHDKPVADYVLSSKGAKEFLDAYEKAIEIALEGYAQEDKHYVTIAVGCTGGQHRSVAMSEELARRLRAHGLNVTVSAREQHKRHSS